MSNSENAPVAYYGDNSNGATAGLLGALALAKPEAYDGVGMIGAYNGSSLRHDVGKLEGVIKDAECNLSHHISDLRADVVKEGQEGVTATKDSESRVTGRLGDILMKLGDVECKIIKENSDQTLYLTNQLSVIREQGIRNEYETKLQGEKVIKEVNTAAQHNAERTQDKVSHGFEENEEKLDALSEKVSKGFFHAREEGLEEKVDALREKLQTAELSRLICCGCGSGPGNSGK